MKHETLNPPSLICELHDERGLWKKFAVMSLCVPSAQGPLAITPECAPRFVQLQAGVLHFSRQEHPETFTDFSIDSGILRLKDRIVSIFAPDYQIRKDNISEKTL